MTDLERIKLLSQKLKCKAEEVDILTFSDTSNYYENKCFKYSIDADESVTAILFVKLRIDEWAINTITDLMKITILYIFRCALKQIIFVNKLRNVDKLNLEYNQLTDLTPLSNLSNLTTLNLNNNQLTDITPLCNLSNLTTLSLSNNQLSDLTPLGNLVNLTNLDLGENQLTDLTPLSKMISLSSLELLRNSISDLTPISKLINLSYLNVGGNKIIDLTPISGLKNLTKPYLWENNITDLTPLSELINISVLHLSENLITDLSPLSKLTNLTTLYLYRNQIAELTPLSNLINLRYLELQGNQVAELTPLSNLINLKYLDLQNNQLSDLLPLSNLKNLKNLDLDDNKITDLRPLIELNLNRIHVSKNPVDGIPLAILEAGFSEIKNYLLSIKVGQSKLYEAKVILIGDGGSGKTSIRLRIDNPKAKMPTEKESTRGIDITKWPFSISKKKGAPNFVVNMWDFGGQLIYHATHRFFLSDSALYILVADSRVDGCDFNYWCYFIQRFGGKSPILIVINEKQNRPYAGGNFHQLGKTFTNIRDRVEINIQSNRGRAKLIKKIKELVLHLPGIGDSYPSKWNIIRNAIEADNRNKIDLVEYLTICRENDVDAEEAISLLRVLNILGTCIFFEDNCLLNRTVYLKPMWIIKTVYKILDDNSIKLNHGKFDRARAKELWNLQEYSLIIDELLELMKNFLLIYEIGESKKYIIPQYLMECQPEYAPLADYRTLTFEYKLFMPKGILHKFIVAMNEHIDGKLVWRVGVMLRYKQTETRAEVLENYSLRTISIKVEGAFIRELMALIVDKLQMINSFYNDPPVTKNIPCNCNVCIKLNEPELYDYDDIQRYIDARKPDIQCRKSMDNVLISELTDFYSGTVYNTLKSTVKIADNIVSDQNKLHIVKIFLASSFELKKEREKIEIAIGRFNKDTVKMHNTYFELDIWEDTIDTVAVNGKQADYNKLVDDAEVFICMFYTKVGKYTLEEFNLAYSNLQNKKKTVQILVFQKMGKVNPDKYPQEDLQSLVDFKERLKEIEHFKDTFTNTDSLLRQIEGQLRKIYKM